MPGEGIVEEQMGDGPVMSLLGFLALPSTQQCGYRGGSGLWEN